MEYQKHIPGKYRRNVWEIKDLKANEDAQVDCMDSSGNRIWLSEVEDDIGPNPFLVIEWTEGCNEFLYWEEVY